MSRVWRIWAVLILFALGTSLITPLIPLYQERDGFGDAVVALFMLCYVVALVPSMLTLGQISDRIGRKPILMIGLLLLGTAQAYLMFEPPLAGVLAARGVQGVAMGAFGGTCTAFLFDATPLGQRAFVSSLAAISIRGGLGFGPGIAGVIAQYSIRPLSVPFAFHLIALAVALMIVLSLPETVTEKSNRPLTLRLEVPEAERAVFWRVLVPSGMLFSLFDGVALSLVPVLLRRDIGVENLAVIGASGFLVLVAGAIAQIMLYRVPPEPAIGWGLLVAALGSAGVVASAPLGSAGLTLVAVALTGAAAGMVFKGGSDLCALIAPPQDRGKLISSYYVACYLGGFSVPLLIIGVLSDIIGLTAALGCLTLVAMISAVWTWRIGLRSVQALSPEVGATQR